MVNSNYRYISLNSTLAAFHGRSVNDHLGRTITDAIQKSVHPLLVPAYRKVITDGIAIENLIVEALAGPRLKRCRVSYHPIRTQGDPLWSVHVTVYDLTPAEPAEDLPHGQLSPMQLNVLKLIGDVKSNKEIAQVLQIAPSTVATHRETIREKTGIHTTVELILYANKVFRRGPLARG